MMVVLALVLIFVIIDLYVRINNINKTIVKIATIVDAKADDHEQRIQELEDPR